MLVSKRDVDKPVPHSTRCINSFSEYRAWSRSCLDFVWAAASLHTGKSPLGFGGRKKNELSSCYWTSPSISPTHCNGVSIWSKRSLCSFVLQGLPTPAAQTEATKNKLGCYYCKCYCRSCCCCRCYYYHDYFDDDDDDDYYSFYYNYNYDEYCYACPCCCYYRYCYY